MPKLVLKAGSRPPWVGLAAAVWIQIAAGNGYNFPLYSSALKSIMGYNQQQVTILGVANDIGESVGILPGIACNKFPPWAVLFVGTVLCFLGYGTLWLAVSQTVQNLPYWLVSDHFSTLYPNLVFVAFFFCLNSKTLFGYDMNLIA
jgi:hypothetical protein